MLASLLAALAPLLPGWGLHILKGVLSAKVDRAVEEERTRRETELARIDGEIQRRKDAAAVVQAGMQHKAFWVPWMLAAVPLSAWFAWGVLDSLANGALPDVATLPPQLKEYADIVWGNIFYVGGGVAGAGILARAIAARR